MAEFQKTLEAETAEACQVIGALMQKSAGLYQEKESTVKEAAALIPSVVDSLLRSRLIESDEKQAATEALRNPANVLNLLKYAAEEKVEREKNASATSFPGREVGRDGVTPTVKKANSKSPSEADIEYDRALGLA